MKFEGVGNSKFPDKFQAIFVEDDHSSQEV